MNKLPIAKRAQIINCLVEGTSLRAASRMADVSINTVYKLLIDAGKACSAYQDQAFYNLPCKRLQLDEIWSFVYAKQRNIMVAKAAPETAGDVWTWVAICADTKLVPSWRIGDRSGATATEFVCDLSKRLAQRVQSLAMDTAPICKQSRKPSAQMSIMRNSSNCMATLRRPPAATARPKSKEARAFAAWAIPTADTSRRVTLSGKTSLCACRCPDSRD